MKPDVPQRICIVRLSALGDVTLTVPLVRTLQNNWPQCQITWVIGKAVYPLLKGLSGVEFIVLDKPRSLADYWRFKSTFKTREFDFLIAMQASLRANLLYPLIKAPIKIGFDNRRSKDLHRFFINRQIENKYEHLLESFLSFAKVLGIHQPQLQWNLPIEASDFAFAEMNLAKQPVLAINPSASKKDRNWLVERYAEVIQRAQQRWGVAVVLTGGPTKEEIATAQDIASLCDKKIINLVGKTTHKQLAAVLARADVLLAPDTGPAHIAVAMGTPVIGLFADVSPNLSAPYLSKHLVIDKYREAVKLFLRKDPDKIPWTTRVHNQQAMGLITVEDVMEKLSIIFSHPNLTI